MRALVTSCKSIPSGTYRRFVQATQVEGLLPDGLVGGEPYLALNALLLTEQDYACLRRLTRFFSSALDRAARILAHDVPALIDLGFPWVAAELLAAEAPRVPIIGRFDFASDVNGRWWMLEFNADTPSGLREAVVADRLVWSMLRPLWGLARPNRGLAAALIRAFRSALIGLQSKGTLGLVTTAAELEDLAQMAFTRDLLCRPLAELGLQVVLADIDNLRRAGSGLELLGRRVDALYRYVPFEALLGSPAFTAIGEAGARGWPLLLNGLYGLLLQNKGLLAWMWAHRDDSLFAPEERAAICAHLPATWMVGDAPSGEGAPALVAKQVFGREGEEVFFSEDLSSTQWNHLRRLRTYVAQQRVDVAPVEAVLPTSVGQEIREVRASVGSFAVDGRWAGFYSRLGGKVINSQAKWVATFVERQGEADARER